MVFAKGIQCSTGVGSEIHSGVNERIKNNMVKSLMFIKASQFHTKAFLGRIENLFNLHVIQPFLNYSWHLLRAGYTETNQFAPFTCPIDTGMSLPVYLLDEIQTAEQR